MGENVAPTTDQTAVSPAVDARVAAEPLEAAASPEAAASREAAAPMDEAADRANAGDIADEPAGRSRATTTYYWLGVSVQVLLWLLVFLAIAAAIATGGHLTEFRYVRF